MESEKVIVEYGREDILKLKGKTLHVGMYYPFNNDETYQTFQIEPLERILIGNGWMALFDTNGDQIIKMNVIRVIIS